MRHKSKCPDFGRFLPMILLSDMQWQEMQGAVVQELLTRNARWIYKAHRNLGQISRKDRTSITDRAVKSWGLSATGLKLTAFQIHRFNNVFPWAQEALPADIVSAYSGKNPHLLVRTMYNALGGRPSQGMLARFQAEAKQIEAASSFKDFFTIIGMPRSDVEIQKMLCKAMLHSLRVGYHS